ncbi:uncharacterized protein LOC127838209 [Dreissena polymorpha]|uniref:uncharacterized protein LOC127838209 n=1 Tax=Dreissena polymorpha TaxID=45954 RepID=UPI002264E452|nr:uncharacterized protein LOC127838209 [Dreissena polymorpha]
METKSILRKATRPTSLKSDTAEILRNKKRHKYKNVTELKPPEKPSRQLIPDKAPTETLAHALLRIMTHKEPVKRFRKLALPKVMLITDADRTSDDDRSSTRSRFSTQSSPTRRFPSLVTRSYDSNLSQSFEKERTPSYRLPEIVSTPRSDVSVIHYDRICGYCKRTSINHRVRKPAAGFCKFCEEYLCADCVHNHRGRLTRLHPVVVFYCVICKEMNILSRRGSGYCVKCRHLYCSVCVLQHCMETQHDVLEGEDLVDVTEMMIGK